MIDEIKESLKISSKLEYLLKTKKIKAKELSDFIGISKQVMSLNRQKLKAGKLPTAKFLVGITLFFEENFL
ncbi:MAG: hypothetical protein ACRCYT_05690 [Cetobacterium sp.]